VMDIAAVVLLVVIGLVLRRWLMPARKAKLPPSGAAPWQRVRTTGLDDGQGGDKPTPLPYTRRGLRSKANRIG
jgi:hypothetical protein